jgi:hypothetical protein
VAGVEGATVSTDYTAICRACRQRLHLGQRSGLFFSFGYGTGDVAGMRKQGEWLMEHVWHEGGVLVVCDDQISDEDRDRLKRVRVEDLQVEED